MPEQNYDSPPRRRKRTEGTAQDAPAPSTPSTPRPEPPGKPVGVLQKRLEKFFVGMALPFAAAGDQHCALVLATRGPIVAEAWANLAAESPAVKKALEGMLKGGAWGGAIASTVALVVPIAAHHGAPIPDPITAIILGQPIQSPDDTTGGEANVSNTHSPGESPRVPFNGGGDFNAADPTVYAGNVQPSDN